MRAALVILGVLCVASVCAADRVYRWTGTDGKTYYGDTPPETARDVRSVDRRVGMLPATPAAPSTAPGRADPAAPTAVAANRDCVTKRTQLGAYRNSVRLVERDSLGREREFTEEERELLIARTEADLKATCGDVAAE
jgi:hypothetical protein